MKFENTHQEAISRIFFIIIGFVNSQVFVLLAFTEGCINHFWAYFFGYLSIALIAIGASIAVLKKEEMFQRVLYFDFYSYIVNLTSLFSFFSVWWFLLDERYFGIWTIPLIVFNQCLLILGFFIQRQKWLKYVETLALHNKKHLQKGQKIYEWDYAQPFEYIELKNKMNESFVGKYTAGIILVSIFLINVLLVIYLDIDIGFGSSIDDFILFSEFFYLVGSAFAATASGKVSVKFDALKMIEKRDNVVIVFQQKERNPFDDDWGTVLVKTFSRRGRFKRYR